MSVLWFSDVKELTEQDKGAQNCFENSSKCQLVIELYQIVDEKHHFFLVENIHSLFSNEISPKSSTIYTPQYSFLCSIIPELHTGSFVF